MIFHQCTYITTPCFKKKGSSLCLQVVLMVLSHRIESDPHIVFHSLLFSVPLVLAHCAMFCNFKGALALIVVILRCTNVSTKKNDCAGECTHTYYYIYIYMTCTHKHTGHGMPKEFRNTPMNNIIGWWQLSPRRIRASCIARESSSCCLSCILRNTWCRQCTEVYNCNAMLIHLCNCNAMRKCNA